MRQNQVNRMTDSADGRLGTKNATVYGTTFELRKTFMNGTLPEGPGPKSGQLDLFLNPNPKYNF